MKSILSLGIAAASLASASADTTIAVLEFGKGGTVRHTSASDETSPAGAASFILAMHRPSKAHRQYAGMSLVPDIFNRADAGIVVGISGAGVTSMPTAMNLLAEGAADVVGHFSSTGTSAEVINRSAKNSESVSDEFERRLVSTADKAPKEEIQVVSLSVNDESAAEADKQLKRMLSTLKSQAQSSDKTYVVHLVIDTPSTRRRLEDAEAEEEADQNQNQNQNQNQAADDDAAANADASYSYSYGQKTMYEIQNFNVFAWTAVGLVTLVMYVMSHFIAMPLMADTLLHGEAAKFGSD